MSASKSILIFHERYDGVLRGKETILFCLYSNISGCMVGNTPEECPSEKVKEIIADFESYYSMDLREDLEKVYLLPIHGEKFVNNLSKFYN